MGLRIFRGEWAGHPSSYRLFSMGPHRLAVEGLFNGHLPWGWSTNLVCTNSGALVVLHPHLLVVQLGRVGTSAFMTYPFEGG